MRCQWPEWGRSWRALFALVVAVLLLPLPARAEDALEYQVKGAFLAKFTVFVEWPSGAFESDTAPLVIGLAGKDPFDSTFEKLLANQDTRGHPLKLKRFRKPGDVSPCHVLFVSDIEEAHWAEIFSKVGQQAVLTVGESERFAEQGGVIGFYKEEGKVRFAINVDAAARAGLKINSKLLALAKVVHDKPSGKNESGQAKN